jgi:hypothetical protein
MRFATLVGFNKRPRFGVTEVELRMVLSLSAASERFYGRAQGPAFVISAVVA